MNYEFRNVHVTNFDTSGSGTDAQRIEKAGADAFVFNDLGPAATSGSSSEDELLRIEINARADAPAGPTMDLRDTAFCDEVAEIFESAVLDFALTGSDSF